MNDSIYPITITGLSLSLIPLLIVAGIFFKWKMKFKTVLYAASRMFIQLVFIGYILTFIFEQDSPYFVQGILFIMLLFASWIALRPIEKNKKSLFVKSLFSIFVGGVPVLAFVSFFVIKLNPWYEPRYLIPLAGMVFSNCMNAVSLASERYFSQVRDQHTYEEARNTALGAALLPITNSLFAIGLVALPGMMTGQILAGIDPLIAVRYQMVIMCTVFGSSGIAAAIFLMSLKK